MAEIKEVSIGKQEIEEMRIDNRVILTKVFFGSGDDYIVITGNDASIYRDFLNARDRFESLLNDMEAKEIEIKKKYGGADVQELSREDEDKICGLKEHLAEETISIMDGVFGEGTTRKFWGDVYAVRPSFVPDEEALMDYFDALIPVVERISEHKVKLEKLASRKRMAKYQPQDYRRPQKKGSPR